MVKLIVIDKWGEANISPSANLLIDNGDHYTTAVHENQLDSINMDCDEYQKYSVLCQSCGYPYRISCCKKLKDNTI